MHHIDQTGHKITLKQHAFRIVSLVPSQTELLYYLDIPPIAQTIFCVHPEKNFKSATKIGGTKKINIAKIKELNPDLIIGNKEENTKEAIDELRHFFPVWLSNIYTVSDAYEMIICIGKMIGKPEKATLLVDEISQLFQNIRPQKTETVLYLIWRKPFMAAGTYTFINHILQCQGYQNCIDNTRYPELSIEDIIQLNPDKILLSSEPYPFRSEHINELKKQVPNAEIRLVNGELYSWYGPRLLQTGAQLMKSSL